MSDQSPSTRLELKDKTSGIKYMLGKQRTLCLPHAVVSTASSLVSGHVIHFLYAEGHDIQ